MKEQLVKVLTQLLAGREVEACGVCLPDAETVTVLERWQKPGIPASAIWQAAAETMEAFRLRRVPCREMVWMFEEGSLWSYDQPGVACVTIALAEGNLPESLAREIRKTLEQMR